MHVQWREGKALEETERTRRIEIPRKFEAAKFFSGRRGPKKSLIYQLRRWRLVDDTSICGFSPGKWTFVSSARGLFRAARARTPFFFSTRAGSVFRLSTFLAFSTGNFAHLWSGSRRLTNIWKSVFTPSLYTRDFYQAECITFASNFLAIYPRSRELLLYFAWN